MNKHWWRAYDEAVDDPKLQRLSGELFKAWFNILCVCSRSGGILKADAPDIAFALRVSESAATAWVSDLCEAGLLDAVPDGYVPHNWNGRQYTSTERTRKHRRKRKGTPQGTPDGTPQGTPTEQPREHEAKPSERPKEPETNAVDSEQTQIQSREEIELADAARPSARKGTRLSDTWQPNVVEFDYALGKGLTPHDIDIEAERFRNYWTAKAGREAAKLDWPATWRNWILTASERKGQANGVGYGRGRESPGESARRLAIAAREAEKRLALGPDDTFGSD